MLRTLYPRGVHCAHHKFDRDPPDIGLPCKICRPEVVIMAIPQGMGGRGAKIDLEVWCIERDEHGP